MHGWYGFGLLRTSNLTLKLKPGKPPPSESLPDTDNEPMALVKDRWWTRLVGFCSRLGFTNTFYNRVV